MDPHTNLSWIKTKAVYRKLNTKEFCFLCLKTTKIKVEDDEELGESTDDYHTRINQPVSLLCVRRHLKLNFTGIVKDTSWDGSVVDFEVDLCNDCEKVINKFSVLFQELEKVQMELDYQLEKINLCISEGAQSPELVQEYSKRMTSDIETLSQLPLIDKIRKEISQKCLKVRIGSHQTVEVPRVKIENVTHSTLVVEERDTGDPAGGPDANFSAPTSPSSVTYRDDDEPLVDSELKPKLHKNNKSTFSSKIFLQDPATGKFCCPSCDKKYGATRNARVHYESVHLNKTWKCDMCSITPFNRYSSLKIHKKNCQKIPQRQSESQKSRQHFKFQCATCWKRFPANVYLQNHQKSVHSKAKFACAICTKTFKSFKYLSEHRRTVHVTAITCKYCNTTFSKYSTYRYHKKECPQRPLITDAKSTPQPFLRDEVGRFHCPSCTKTYPRPSEVRRHYNSVHLKKKFKCDLCQLAVFSHPHTLAEHKKNCLDTLQQRVRDGELRKNFKFQCQTCSKRFKTQNGLCNHKNAAHSSLRRFNCDYCEKSFKTGRHLRDHRDSIHLKKTYPCKFCNKILKHASAYYYHEKQCGIKNKRIKLEVTGS